LYRLVHGLPAREGAPHLVHFIYGLAGARCSTWAMVGAEIEGGACGYPVGLNPSLLLGRVRGGWGDFVVTEEFAKVFDKADDDDDRRAHQSDQEQCGYQMHKECAHADHANIMRRSL
jgi:hypothetical protein